MLFQLLQFANLCAQTLKERKLTVLYIGLFAVFVVLLLVDIYGQKKYAGGKVINKIIIYFVILALIAFIVAYLTMN